jgi:hypothetical protein
MVHALLGRHNGGGKSWNFRGRKFGWAQKGADPRFFLELGKRHPLVGWTWWVEKSGTKRQKPPKRRAGVSPFEEREAEVGSDKDQMSNC